jgi:hypothetical protein
MHTSKRRRIKEIAQRLADGTASPEAAQELRKLLDELAQDSDFESLPEITQFIRQHLEAGPLEEGRVPSPPPQTPSAEPETEGPPQIPGSQPIPPEIREAAEAPDGKAGYAPPKAVVIAAAAAVLLLVGILMARLLLLPSATSESRSRGTGDQTPAVEETAADIAEVEEPVQSVQADATLAPTRPGAATPTRQTPTPSPSPALARQEYTIRACVGWQDDPEAGLTGSTITWAAGTDDSSQGEIDIQNEDGCVEFPVSALPNTRIALWAKPPGGQMRIVSGVETDAGLGLAWEAVEEEGSLALTATLGEETSAETVAQFLAVAQRTFSGQVVDQEGAGISGAGLQLWSKTNSGDDWQPINVATSADPDGTFVLTGTTGLPEAFYRIGISNTVASSYVYTTTSVSAPDAGWIAAQDAGTPSVAWIETQTALGADQMSVADIVFTQDLEYVVLGVQEALIEPEGLEIQSLSQDETPSQDEILSKLIIIDSSNVDRLQAQWQDIQLPPGTYALEIWTPENSSARVRYQVLSSGQLLDQRVSYQSTRQERGEVNQWIDFSKTLNPSLVIELPTSLPVTVIAGPSLRTTNREYNLSGNVVFGVGPVRFVKQ